LESNTYKFKEETMPDNATVYYAQVGTTVSPKTPTMSSGRWTTLTAKLSSSCMTG